MPPDATPGPSAATPTRRHPTPVPGTVRTVPARNGPAKGAITWGGILLGTTRRALRLLRRLVPWLFALVLLAALTTFVLWAGPQWSEAIVQALAAIGGLLYWRYRTKPRLSLRLHYRGAALYFQLTNIGNRTARQVELHCEPPIEWKDEQIGPVERFGDMAAGQRYTLMIGFSSDVDTPKRTTFRLSHDRRFLKRHVETMRLGGSGWSWTVPTDSGTPIHDLAESVNKIDKKLDDPSEAQENHLVVHAATGWRWGAPASPPVRQLRVGPLLLHQTRPLFLPELSDSLRDHRLRLRRQGAMVQPPALSTPVPPNAHPLPIGSSRGWRKL